MINEGRKHGNRDVCQRRWRIDPDLWRLYESACDLCSWCWECILIDFYGIYWGRSQSLDPPDVGWVAVEKAHSVVVMFFLTFPFVKPRQNTVAFLHKKRISIFNMSPQ